MAEIHTKILRFVGGKPVRCGGAIVEVESEDDGCLVLDSVCTRCRAIVSSAPMVVRDDHGPAKSVGLRV